MLRQLAPDQLLRRTGRSARTARGSPAGSSRHGRCSMLTSAMPIGACSKAPRKRSSASCTIASARRAVGDVAQHRGRERSSPVAPARERGLQRELLRRRRRARRSSTTTVRSPSSSCGAGSPSSSLQRAADHVVAPAGRRSARRPRSRTRRCPASSTRHDRVRGRVGDRAEVLLAQAQRLLGLLAPDQRARPGRRPRTRARPGARPPRAPRTRRTRSPPRPRRSARTGTATPPARPTACANSPRSNPGSERTSRIQTGPAPSPTPCPAGRCPGTNDSASVTRRNDDRPSVAACQAGLHTSVRPSALRTHAWPIAQPVRSHTPRSTVCEGTLGRVRAGDRQRQLVRERKLVLGPAALGDVAADAVDQLEAGVRPRAELEPAVGAVDGPQPRLEGRHAARRDRPARARPWRRARRRGAAAPDRCVRRARSATRPSTASCAGLAHRTRPSNPVTREQVGGEVEQQRPGVLVGKLVHPARDVSGAGAQRSLLLFGDDSETVTRWVVVERPVRHLGLVK